ncbi:cation transporter [Candidatus Pacearchaeota archaeon]|nr:cation transporter [Candidatus Pacearchaeota archaeon]
MNKKLFISFLAIVANLFLAIGKVIVGTISKSAAIIADGINSATDVIASTVGFIGIKIAEKPADKGHPYGHGRAEVISGFVITLIIFFSAIWIIYDAIKAFFTPADLNINYLAFGIMGISALINGVMSFVKVRSGKKYNSVSLISDGIHSRIDLLVSLAIFIGLFFINSFAHLDSILALLVGIYIIREAFFLGKETTDSLLGASASKEIENKIKEIIKKKDIKLSNLKTQKMGNKIFAEIIIKLPSKLKVDEVQVLTKKLEKNLINQIDVLEYVTIQVESHDVGRGYFQPSFGKGFGWQNKGRFKDTIKEAQGKGPEGYCICSKCGYKQKHERGVPCSTIKCPKCGEDLKRE